MINKHFLITSFLAGSLLLPPGALSQDIKDFDGLLRAGVDEAGKLMDLYLEPAVVGLSYGMSNGWYNTAETHLPLGFDITISANIASVPTSKEYFILDPAVFKNVSIQGPENRVPTILGSAETVKLEFSYLDSYSGTTITGTEEIAGIGMKDSFGYNIVPSPMIQVGLGTFRNTDLMIRYMPALNYGAYTTCAFGFGIKHDIKQWIPAIRQMPFDLSVLAAFSGLDNRLDLSEMNLDGENQEALFDINNWTVQALFSKKISVLTLYGGVGYSSVCSTFQMKGSYIIEDQFSSDYTITFEDPLNIIYDEGSLRATAGMRLKLALFTIHGDYTFQKYHTFSAGVGISVR